MHVIASVQQGWSWTGLRPIEVVDDNAFGNLIIRDDAGRFWRVCPEELSCSVVANSAAEYQGLTSTEDFREDWSMVNIVNAARAKCGPLGPGMKYCLKIPATLGGKYETENFATITLGELIRASGDIAQQIQNVPDGQAVRLVAK